MKHTIYTHAKNALTNISKEVKRTTNKQDRPYINQTINDAADSFTRQFNFHAMKGAISERRAALYCEWIHAHASNLQA